ncbi:6195_t:CDS:2 [Paraglomus brasilianum]|uniref:6195_t:CDS:1 n=1 Tax=Paraglomus brasilianum TaxID=144538 RepID=A0A9N9FYM1_9GLOM|nr:6195_t:CDS:2 [Paraglomus brasilianum]
MSSPAIYTLTFIDRAALSYFKNNEPVEWSYRGFLEKMKLFILEDETDDADLPATWRHRFFRVIKLIMNNDNGEKSRIIDQIGTRLLDQCPSMGCASRNAQPRGGAPRFLQTFIRGAPLMISGEKQTGFSKKYWKQLKAERARNNAENDLENKRTLFELESQTDALDILAMARKCQTHKIMEKLNPKKAIDEDINTEEINTEQDINTDEDLLDFEIEPERSATLKKICMELDSHSGNGNIVDMRPKSAFLKSLPSEIVEQYHQEMEDKTADLIPDHVHQFLVDFFSQSSLEDEWQNRIDDLRAPNNNDFLMVALVRILRRTLPQFIKAFSLGAFNPLLAITTIEKPHLNAFVHPCLEASLWHVAKINYEFGEISSPNHMNRDCADGVGYMKSADKFQLVYMEGARPVAKEDKEIADAKKIAQNMKEIFSSIIKESLSNRKRLPQSMAIFGGQSFRLRIYLLYLEYFGGKFWLNEVENAILPRDFSEMEDFVWFYEAIIKWALLARDVVNGFNEARKRKRSLRQFTRLLDDL